MSQASSADLPRSTRQVVMRFDAQGRPCFRTQTSPISFTTRALCVLPPRKTIPIIFVPGIMGTNLRSRTAHEDGEKASAWSPPNSTLGGLAEYVSRVFQTPASRQEQLDPEATEVDDDGKVRTRMAGSGLDNAAVQLTTLDRREAKKRGWGSLHWASYGPTLIALEHSLNQQVEQPGVAPPVWLKTLQALMEPSRYADASQWGSQGPPPAITEQDLTKLGDYFLPVWAYGYNWLQSNEQSAQGLVKRIEEILQYYQQSEYFEPIGQVILVTHSMGGLVARRAAQLAPQRIRGVLHGVQPFGGAPVVYRRFRMGTETHGPWDIVGAMTAEIMGAEGQDITPVMANASGPLELAPTVHYGLNWLEIRGDWGQQQIAAKPDDLIYAFNAKTTYDDVYATLSTQRWWGMVNPRWIDPANKHGADQASGHYQRCLQTAKAFHEKLGTYIHPHTHAHFGDDTSTKKKTFHRIVWRVDIPKGIVPDLFYPQQHDKLLDWHDFEDQGEKGVLIHYGGQSYCLTLSDRDGPGDGTVPTPSAELIERIIRDQAKPGESTTKRCFRLHGFDHQDSFKYPTALMVTLYGIVDLLHQETSS